ncbi:hypothetical protein JRO89_XS13G0179400 [Xanthoceras sorbifolium]|uniref:Retrovirus-related Pol polyprotein from transposon RE1 n=1 Tax=Xanthoceras sorbifolium TaxID=99658 RepID=A0ABQ8H8Z5_9ROSI|nr:hypothetical protein JRO89_XS13G0179400 [Xanthoceras sorbifolium]
MAATNKIPTTPVNSIVLSTNEFHLITINISAQAPLKLTSSNYLSWKLQFETLFIGYDLLKATTSQEAWTILANTYVKPTRGRIKQVKNFLKNHTKGTMNITNFIHSIKARADELAILGAPMDQEDLTEKILDGLGDDYKKLVRSVQARDTSITFEELYQKLLSFEASIQANIKTDVHFPITTNPTNRTNTTWQPQKFNQNWRLQSQNPTGNAGWRLSPTNPGRPLMATNSGAILLKGNTKDGVYEWPANKSMSSPILAFSNVKTTFSNWHHRLESVFPYTSLQNHLPCLISSTVDTWIPLVLTVSFPSPTQPTSTTPPEEHPQELPHVEDISHSSETPTH